MSSRHARPKLLAGALISVSTLAAVQLAAFPAAGAPAGTGAGDRAAASVPSSRAATAAAVGRVEDRTARALAASLADATWRSQVRDAVLADKQGDLRALTGRPAAAQAGKRLTSSLVSADRQIAAAKGLGADTGSLLRLRLAADSMRKDLKAGAVPLVAAAEADDHAKTITAYDSNGAAHTLDAGRTPDRPVYVLDIDESKALAAGMKVMRQEFGERGLTAPRASTTGSGFWTTRMTGVALSDDEEPWFKGDAEVYSLVTGFGSDGRVRVDPVEMPYLDKDGVVYHPNQILVNWSNYKYNLADVVMMEEDGSTNYRDLAKAIAGILLTIADQGAYIPLVNAVLDAIPDDWWTDDPDYVDSWYTLAKNDTGRRDGARSNGWMTLEPYYVQGL
ncbi:DUF3103 family protein [Streptomyces sp. SLBN-118]|uniref:DUF3103 family protein n=1 Tax=Streptomyces sp. SLBN-118 TaxID=2768454 RepID=UPI0011530542|nr:DUF3103 family protein [Streptomyces sp. SLBN-118]TQK45265.1 DUF3103 family protein [Streptomyces sp. SLBN-118]